MTSENEWLWLSHVTSSNTFAYGGGSAFNAVAEMQMKCGDSCNTVTLNLSNHIGSHVDAPRHFISDGLGIDKYSASDWVFKKPILVSIVCDRTRNYYCK